MPERFKMICIPCKLSVVQMLCFTLHCTPNPNHNPSSSSPNDCLRLGFSLRTDIERYTSTCVVLQSLRLILIFHLLTTLHKSDPHCNHHLCHHQSLLFFTPDLKHTSASSLFHLILHHIYSLD